MTDTLGAPSPDAAPVAIPGWCHNPRSTPPIHRRAELAAFLGVRLGLSSVRSREVAVMLVDAGWVVCPDV